MRIAILSDIHANLEALVEVEAALGRLAVDRVVCTGDVVGYGASPNACCERIRDLASITLLGNHDAAVAGRMEYAYYYDAARQALDWTAQQLDPDHLAWLRSLPYTHRVDDVAFSHGSPVLPGEFEYVFALEQAQELVAHQARLAPVTFIGHSHLCKAFALDRHGQVAEVSAPALVLDPDRQYIVSVGSVGQPRDYDSRACFVTYDTEARRVEYHRVSYDIATAARRIFDAALAENFGKRLFLGV
ncbi:metallophosphoesterase family protein [Anaeromyxobacter diazotrophicus]|uniref:Metallophosphoesterase n=1 Tax=Anaeromyxobacter diazotrophicus TaxID=2590199 RepID=A0A7I9VLP9_9BACT|nr:metallophosphoesterase family protein [Anaeromyxobacter diazotrophicus]GEJ57324.1 metallophosphoesterase [Anaeromyxobacter diazotrophicus]